MRQGVEQAQPVLGRILPIVGDASEGVDGVAELVAGDQAARADILREAPDGERAHGAKARGIRHVEAEIGLAEFERVHLGGGDGVRVPALEIGPAVEDLAAEPDRAAVVLGKQSGLHRKQIVGGRRGGGAELPAEPFGPRPEAALDLPVLGLAQGLVEGEVRLLLQRLARRDLRGGRHRN